MGTHSFNCKIIAIAGPTASGKTTLANTFEKKIGVNRTTIISQDNYYKNFYRLSLLERKKLNFDDLKTFDLNLLIKHLLSLKNGKTVQMPLYDFVESKRLKNTKKIQPKEFIILEGLMPFFDRNLRKLFDYKIYISADNAICLARRLKRDIKKRGDSIESVCRRYFKDVLPMQKKYVEPQKKWADLIINE
ncbi:MAG: uridine kinase [Candidatus Omnitrophota bacterium]